MCLQLIDLLIFCLLLIYPFLAEYLVRLPQLQHLPRRGLCRLKHFLVIVDLTGKIRSKLVDFSLPGLLKGFYACSPRLRYDLIFISLIT